MIDLSILYVIILGIACFIFYFALFGILFVIIADYIMKKKVDKKNKKYYY